MVRNIGGNVGQQGDEKPAVGGKFAQVTGTALREGLMFSPEVNGTHVITMRPQGLTREEIE